MGNVIVGGGSEDTSSPLYKAVEAASIGLGKAGAAVGEPLRRGAENYLGNVGKAFHESGEYARQGLENTVSDKGPLYNVSGPLQYMLGSTGQVFSPLTGAAMSAGQAATQLTGNPDFGNRVEFVGGLMDPSHVGMLKGAAAIPMAARTAAKAEEAAQAVALAKQQRELSPLGFYSHGAETAAGLQQAKGTPQQMAGVLRQAGVKPEEMFASGFADEAATSALRSKIEADFAPKVEAAKKAMEGLEPGTKEFQQAERQFKNISSTMRSEMDRALALGEDWASRPSVTREEVAQHFNERMPQIEETVLGRDQLSLKERHRYYDLDDAVAKDGVNALSPEQQQEYYTLQNKWNKEKPTKFGQYTLPGGENYREVLLKMPEGYGAPKQALDDLAAAKERASAASKAYTDALMAELDGTSKLSPEAFAALEKEESIARSRVRTFEKLANQPAFQSSHWQDPNVLAHLRMADRTGPNGEKILHVEEIQSDWGQKGKKEGFVTKYKPEDIKEIDPANITSERRRNEFWNFETPTGAIDVPRNSRWPTIEAARQHILDNMRPTGVPTAPYVTNTQAWTDLALKRALREAAEGGYDKLVWTPGAEQAKRYSLSHHIDEVQYAPGRNGTFYVEAYKGNNNVFNKPNATAKEIADTFGQEIAEKIASGHGEVNRHTGYNVLSGLDLETGGSGMKGYYDKIVPNQLSKLVKKLDPEAKVGITDVMLPPKGGIGHNNPPLEAPGITITPKMREAILGGQTAFARGGTIPFGPEAAQDAVRIAKQQAGRR
jgi:hypothetical protein